MHSLKSGQKTKWPDIVDRSVYRIKDMNPNKIFLYDYSRLRKCSLLLDLGPTSPPPPPADTSVPPSHLGLVAPLSVASNAKLMANNFAFPEISENCLYQTTRAI